MVQKHMLALVTSANSSKIEEHRIENPMFPYVIQQRDPILHGIRAGLSPTRDAENAQIAKGWAGL